METTVNTEADRHVAQVLRDQFSEDQSRVDWDAVASAAISALVEYEDALNQQFLHDNPDILSDLPRVVVEQDLRKKIAADIRKIHCHFDGTSAIAFGAARELSALTALGDED